MTTATSTVVFTDVVGSTSLRAQLGEEVADLLFRGLLRALDEVVAAHAGQVVSTAGDGMMAAFGSATDAILAAVSMQQRVTRQFADVRLRIGVAAGDVSWENDDCFGLPVVTAARLESHAEPAQILASGLVRHLVGNRSAATFRFVEVVELKGLPEPVESFEVEWEPLEDEAGEDGGFTMPCPAALAATPAFAFVGREQEREDLESAWTATQAGGRRTVLIGGEAGAGKTRLAFEFARRCAADGAAVLLGACDTELALPYQPWVQILEHLMRAMPEGVAASMSDELGDVALLVPQLERRVPGLRRAPPADPETERYRLFSGVDALLADAARRWPTIVVLDDLHWASAQTLALLRHVARSATAARLLVIGTFRDTGDEITDPLAGCLADLRRTETASRLRLVGLDEGNVERFLVGAVGHELDRDLRALARTLAAHSAGNAFYLGELWRHVVASGVVAPAGERWAVRSGGGELGVPDSLREVVANRLTKLSTRARRLIEVTAVAGQDVELRVLTQAADLPADEVGVGVDELVDANLLSEVPGVLPTYQFAHAIVRDTVEGTISASARARLHHRVGEAVERVYGADHRPVLARLARHFAAAAALGDSEKAVRYARQAAGQAMEAVAYDEAISHLGIAVELSLSGSVERVSLLLDLGVARDRHGLHHDAMATFELAFAAARELGLVSQAAQAAVGFDLAVQMSGLSSGPAVEIVSEALALLGDDQGVLHTRLQASLARALALAGRNEEARVVGEEALSAARRYGDPDVLMTALQAATVYTDEPRRGLSEAREYAALAQGRGDLFAYAYAKACEVRALITLGAIDEARRELEVYKQVAERGRFVHDRYTAMSFEVMLAVIDGRFDDAEQLAGRTHEFGESAHTEFDAGVYGVHMYVLRREQGRLEEVAPILRLAAAVESDQPVWRPGLAALFADTGMLDDASREFERLAREDFAAVPRDAMWPGCLTFLAEVCIALGDRERAAILYRELEPYRGLAMMVGYTICLGPAERLMGSLAAVMGHRHRAEQHFTAALELAERSGSPPWLARVQYDWAIALDNRPDLLEAADATSRSIGMRGLGSPRPAWSAQLE